MLKRKTNNKSSIPFGDPTLKSENWEKNRAAFEHLHTQLRENHFGEYVAFADKKLIDSDPDKAALARRVAKLPDRDCVFIGKVIKRATPTTHFDFVEGNGIKGKADASKRTR